jgi:ELWxxDGT repeat protein
MFNRPLHLMVILLVMALFVGLSLSLASARGVLQGNDTPLVPASSYPSFLTNVGDVIFFAATDDAHGTELWMSNGTKAGTRLVADIFPGPESSFPTDLVNMNGKLYFSAADDNNGFELWTSDGTKTGTKLVADIAPGYIEWSVGDTPEDPFEPLPVDVAFPPLPEPQSMYQLNMGSQHLYQEPWGGDRGNPCEAWRTGNFDDTQPHYRGFNLELKLTNNSAEKVSDEWAENLRFFTADGKELAACYYGYDGMGPAPQGATSVTFFTVVPQGDYVSVAELTLNGELLKLCFDGRGGDFACR